MSTTLYRGGSVYAPASPRATAMLVDDAAGVVTWIGDEAAADRLGRPDRVVDLGAGLAAPAFVDACTVPGPRRRAEAARAGIAAVHVMAGSDEGSGAADEVLTDDGSVPEVGTVLYWHGPGAAPSGARPATASGDPADVSALVRTATEARRQCSLWAGDDPAAVMQGVEAAAQSLAGGDRAVASCAHRLVADVPLPDAVVTALARLGMVAVVIGGAAVDLRALASAGVPFAFGSRPPVAGRAAAGDGRPGEATGSDRTGDPWDAIRLASAVSAGSAVSARAAFAAATRGGHRAAGRVGGDLRPGAEATFVVWSFDGDLVVRTPDTRVAAWSTDPRAATPGLPDLELGTPRQRHLVVAGRVVHVT